MLGGAYVKSLAAYAPYCVLIVFPMALVLRGNRRALLLIMGCSLLTGSIRSEGPPTGKLVRERTRIWGRVLEWQMNDSVTRGTLQVFRIGNAREDPPILIWFSAWEDYGAAPQSRWIALSGVLEPNRGGTNPGERSPRTRGRFSAKGKPQWGPGGPPRDGEIRRRVTSRLRQRLPGWAGRLAEAMLLGRSHALRSEEVLSFRRSGLAHLVAVSGLHVGFVFALALGFFSFLPYTLRCLVATTLGFLYAALAGFPPSACRAATLMGLALLGGALGRGRSPEEWVILALVWITWTRPSMWTELGFQLSLAAVAGISIAVTLMAGWKSKWKPWLTPIVVSLGAQWGTLPWMVGVFGMLPPLALAPNLVAVPLAALFVPAAALSLLMPEGSCLLSLGQSAAQMLAAGIGWIANLSASHLVCLDGLGRPPALILILFLAVIILGFFRTLPPKGTLTASLLLAVLILIPWPPARGPWVSFLDVGQGDAAVFRLSDGTNWLVDAGDDRGPSDAVSKVVIPYLRQKRIRRIHGVVLSHPHRDHVGALRFLWGRVPVDSVFISPCFGELRIPEKVAGLRKVQAPARLGRSGFVSVLHPRTCSGVSINDASLVVGVRDRDMQVLFPGDIEVLGESRLLQSEDLSCFEVLKVAHHGSHSSTTVSFLGRVEPKVSIISCGSWNRYGHPDSLVCRRLAAWGDVFRTDRSGAVEITYPQEGLRVHPWLGKVVPN